MRLPDWWKYDPRSRKLTIDLERHEGQSAIWNSDTRFLAMIMGSGGGKTSFGPVWMYREFSKWPADEFLVIAPTYKMLQRASLPRFLQLFHKTLRLGEYHKADAVYELKTGGAVYMGSADKWENLEGPHVRAVWMDEPGRMKFEVFQVAQRRTGLYQSPVLLTTTPYNLGWLKTEFYDRWKDGDSDYFVYQGASVVNPAYPVEEFERAKRTLPPWRFKMFYEGRFERPEGLIWPVYDVVEPFEIPADWPRYAGMDFGYNDPTAVLWIAKGPDSVYFVYREWYGRGRTFKDIAKALHVESKGEDVWDWIGDPSGAQYIAELNALMIPVRAASREGQAGEWVKSGIVKVDQLFRSGRLKIFRGLGNLLDEIEGWQWRMVEDRPTDKPGEEAHHLCDALRYVINEVDRYGVVSI